MKQTLKKTGQNAVLGTSVFQVETFKKSFVNLKHD